MARFSYTVQDSSGTVTTGSINADDEDGAVSALQSKGFFILSIQADGEKGSRKETGFFDELEDDIKGIFKGKKKK